MDSCGLPASLAAARDAMIEMPDLVDSLISNGREERHVEFKRTMNWSDAGTKSKVVKSSIAMANLRDGGFIVFGIERQYTTRSRWKSIMNALIQWTPLLRKSLS